MGEAATQDRSRTPDDLPRLAYERVPGAASRPLPRTYRRRESGQTALHQAVRGHLATLLDEARRGGETGAGYPGFIEREFRRYLSSGIPGRGFAHLRCPACGFKRLVAFMFDGDAALDPAAPRHTPRPGPAHAFLPTGPARTPP